MYEKQLECFCADPDLPRTFQDLLGPSTAGTSPDLATGADCGTQGVPSKLLKWALFWGRELARAQRAKLISQ